MSKDKPKQKKNKKPKPKNGDSKLSEVNNLKMQLARALADYDNLQKRVARDTIEIGDRVRANFLTELLPAIDMLYGVQKHLNDPGLALSIQQFEQAIQTQQIEKIEPKVGEQFDENLHEAIDGEEDPKKAGTIASVMRNGWKFTDGSVIQHAKVKVYK